MVGGAVRRSWAETASWFEGAQNPLEVANGKGRPAVKPSAKACS